jgi:hypothetical protein
MGARGYSLVAHMSRRPAPTTSSPASAPLPNFFIVGAPKAGTTSLHAYLGQHPDIFLSPLKEPYYFAAEVRLETVSAEEFPRVAREQRALARWLRAAHRPPRFGGFVADWDDYLSLFRDAGTRAAIGEATPHYLWSPTAPAGIAQRIPRARIIVSLRNPIDRAFSDYLHMRTVGAIRRTFREQIAANLRDTQRQIGRDWPFLEYGHYHEQLSRWLAHFPRSQIHISLFEELEHRPLELLDSLQAFLGVERRIELDVSVRHNVPRVPRSRLATTLLRAYARAPALGRCVPTALRRRLGARLVLPRTALAMDPADRAYLAGYYRDEIRRLSALLDRDLAGWLDPVRSC